MHGHLDLVLMLNSIIVQNPFLEFVFCIRIKISLCDCILFSQTTNLVLVKINFMMVLQSFMHVTRTSCDSEH